MYRPRSRGEIIAARMTWTKAVSPPAPTPWTTRNAMRVPAFCASPASPEPTTKITRASWMSVFLLVRSASLPQIGVVAVIASRVAVTTQVYADSLACRSEMIRGSALATTVLARTVTNMPSSRPDRASRISGGSSPPAAPRSARRAPVGWWWPSVEPLLVTLGLAGLPEERWLIAATFPTDPLSSRQMQCSREDRRGRRRGRRAGGGHRRHLVVGAVDGPGRGPGTGPAAGPDRVPAGVDDRLARRHAAVRAVRGAAPGQVHGQPADRRGSPAGVAGAGAGPGRRARGHRTAHRGRPGPDGRAQGGPDGALAGGAGDLAAGRHRRADPAAAAAHPGPVGLGRPRGRTS